MEINGPLTEWILEQLERASPQSFQGGARAITEWVFGSLMGERELKEVRALLDRPAPTAPRASTVLLPGILGSLLSSLRGISTTLWFNPTLLLDGHLNLLDLNDDGTDDRSPDVEIQPTGIEKMYYLKMIIALANATRLYEFPYDWRRHIEHSAHILHNSLERWSQRDPDRRYVLIAHSMGGLVARAYLALYPQHAEEHIARLLLIGSPLWGVPMATAALAGAAVHTQIVSRLNDSNDAIDFVARLPSSYQLLPAPPEHYHSELPYPCDWDLYNAAAWRLPHIRQDYLDAARRLYALLDGADPQVEIAQIAGCNSRTLTRVQLSDSREQQEGEPEHLTLAYAVDGIEGGDGTVPLYATRASNITSYYVNETHDLLPGNSKVIDATLAIAQGETPKLPTDPPPAERSELPLTPVSIAQQVAQLRKRIETGSANRDDLTKLFFLKH